MNIIPIAQYLEANGVNEIEDKATATAGDGDASGVKHNEGRYALGYDQGRADAEYDFAKARAQIAAEHEQRLVEAEAAWQLDVAAQLAEQLSKSIMVSSRQLASSVTQILKPFLQFQLMDTAVTELEQLLARIHVADGGSSQIHIQSSADLIRLIEVQTEPLGLNLTFTTSEHQNIEITVDQTHFEIRLQEWMDRLEEIAR